MCKIFLILVSILFFAACTQNENSETILDRPDFESIVIGSIDDILIAPQPATDNWAQVDALMQRFPSVHVNHNDILIGEILRIGAPGQQDMFPFDLPTMTEALPGRKLAMLMFTPLLARNARGALILGDEHNGPVIVTIDTNTYTVTLTMREDVRIFWHDGVELTLDGIMFAHEWLADFPSSMIQEILTTSYLYNIDGFTSYIHRSHHALSVDYISGLMLSDDERQLTIQFNHFDPSILYAQLGILDIPLARHHYVAQGNVNLGFGAFINDGFSMELEVTVFRANPSYWQGMPYLDAIHVVHFGNQFSWQGDVEHALLRGDVDVVMNVSDQIIERVDDDIVLLGQLQDNQWSLYYVFNLGINELNEHGFIETRMRTDNHPIMNADFRRAIAHAWNQNYVLGNIMQSATQVAATSFLDPLHYFDMIQGTQGFVFDLSYANRILDNAGFNRTEDGLLRYDEYGNLAVVYIAMSGGSFAPQIFEFHRDNLAQIGIELRLWQNRMGGEFTSDSMLRQEMDIRYNNNLDVIFHDIHIMEQFLIVNATGTALVWRENRIVYRGNDFTAIYPLFDAFNSIEAFDSEVRMHTGRQIDAFLHEDVPGMSMGWNMGMLTAINERVTNFSVLPAVYTENALAWHLVGLTH